MELKVIPLNRAASMLTTLTGTKTVKISGAVGEFSVNFAIDVRVVYPDKTGGDGGGIFIDTRAHKLNGGSTDAPMVTPLTDLRIECSAEKLLETVGMLHHVEGVAVATDRFVELLRKQVEANIKMIGK